MMDAGMEVVAGREAKRMTRERASSRSRRESVKVGYLKETIVSERSPAPPPECNPPLLDDVVNAVHRLGLLQVLCEAEFSSTKCPRELLCERLVLSQLAEDGLVEEVLDVLLVVERGGRGGSLVRLLARARLSRVDTCEDDELLRWTDGTRTAAYP